MQRLGLVIEVVDADTDEPLCDASVHLVHATHEEDLASDDLEPCRYLGGTVAGSYQIEVSREGYESQDTSVDVGSAAGCTGLETREVSVALPPIP